MVQGELKKRIKKEIRSTRQSLNKYKKSKRTVSSKEKHLRGIRTRIEQTLRDKANTK
ncbi:hypothetical protein NEOKW01_1716 [Nematocida sp. AWRm80]|nr:hypothetical protein NEOKW01_1716 [Nematocida sp. AWRm80]